jgi:hypothetical protein
MIAVTDKTRTDQRIHLARTGRVLLKNVLQFELLALLQNYRATYGFEGPEKFCSTLKPNHRDFWTSPKCHAHPHDLRKQ